MTTRTVLGFRRVVFLSHVNAPGMPVFPGDPAFQLRPLSTVPVEGFFVQEMTIGEHTGTHWGAPRHLNPDEHSADELAPEDFFFPAVVVDVRVQSVADPDFRLGVDELTAFEAVHGKIPEHAMVIAWTGFSDRWDDPAAYANADASGTLHYPGFGVDATRWLINERTLGGLSIDTLGVDPGDDSQYLTNTLLLHDRRIHLENLTGLDQMPAIGGWILVGGLRNQGGSGSPATVFGLVP